MRKLVYSMTISVDGFIADKSGSLDWGAPDDEIFRFHTQRVEETAIQLCGRRLYETMGYWESVEEESLSPDHAKFARLWKALPKIVFSKTLETVVGNAKLVRDGLEAEVQRLKEQPGMDIAVGGAALAQECMRLNLVDDWRLFVAPVLLGGGVPCFSQLAKRTEMKLVETKTFASKVVYLRYCRD